MRILMGEGLQYNSSIHVGSHNYADLFVQDRHQVFWLGCTVHLLNIVRASMGNALHKSLVGSWKAGVIKIRENLWTYHPLTLLPHKDFTFLASKLVQEHTLQFTLPPVRKILRRLGFERVELLWLSQSLHSLSLARYARYEKLIYRMSDDYLQFKGIPPNMEEAEREIIEIADTVFVTSRKLYENVRASAGHKVFYLPNGVDLAHFDIPTPAEPLDIAAIPHPRVLYVGAIKEWFDLNLMIYAAKSLPDFSFVLVGPHINIQRAAAVPNVHILGVRPYGQLPPYLHHCEVGVIPFLKTPLTDNTNPVKIFEYFASGLPVVSTNIYEVEQLHSPALITKTPGEFVDGLKEALDYGRGHAEYLQFARANSWQKRYARIKERWLE
jgi:glycosyltransferase involved in cell wall biosynthesis